MRPDSCSYIAGIILLLSVMTSCKVTGWYALLSCIPIDGASKFPSNSMTSSPSFFRALPKFIAWVVLPTPPFPPSMAMNFAILKPLFFVILFDFLVRFLCFLNLFRFDSDIHIRLHT